MNILNGSIKSINESDGMPVNFGSNMLFQISGSLETIFIGLEFTDVAQGADFFYSGQCWFYLEVIHILTIQCTVKFGWYNRETGCFHIMNFMVQ